MTELTKEEREQALRDFEILVWHTSKNFGKKPHPNPKTT